MLDTDDCDPLVGSAIAGQFRVMEKVHQDEFSILYTGLDISNDSTIGVRIAKNKQSHARMLDWLGWAMMTTGKDAILAMGHLEQSRLFYIVLSEVALDIMRKPQKPEEEPIKLAINNI
jgi:hypothetical protein